MLSSYRLEVQEQGLLRAVSALRGDAIVPLLSILYEVVVRGLLSELAVSYCQRLQGGIGPAIQGSLILIGLN